MINKVGRKSNNTCKETINAEFHPQSEHVE